MCVSSVSGKAVEVRLRTWCSHLYGNIMGGGPSQPFPQPSALLDTPWRTIKRGDNERVLQFVKNYKPKTEVMGGGPSQPLPEPLPQPPPQPPALLDTPWRTIKWGDNERVLQFVKNYKPKTEGQQLRVLLHGPVGSGKSSFINSVQSVIYGRMYTQALVNSISHTSFPKRYSTYKVQEEGGGSFCPLVFNDMMGLDPIDGFLVDDIKLALKGHVKDGYRFDPETQLLEDDPFYNRSPTSNDKVHILVCVIPANTISLLSKETLQKIQDIRIAASELEIPQVVVLTKIDEISPEMSGNLRNAYRLKSLKEKMEEFSMDVGFPMNCIFPVKNYNTEIDLDDDVDSLILSVLKHIINFGDDCINFRKSSERLINFQTEDTGRISVSA